ncbi:VOC family protein [Aquimarina sp. 2201CG5-10]|uniref:VOC family protein n=1 Tax=Aquimarina callyspongiae TaxID=3098150 RepID=UPI002AB55E5C|nr:VOC family protein [Aquimarina sp. 2201CG5-10]MDY8137353.1 hypothetical protein [Aquimarina sp. 2201CG5-10]
MKTYIISTLFLLITNLSFGQKTPDWFVDNMTQSIGTWITDNSSYKTKQEPFDQYGMDWEWGIGKRNITGKLYGLINGKKQGIFWEFRQYWDFDKNQGIIIQYGADGSIGKGPMILKGNQLELVQDFISPEGKKTVHGHRSTLNKNIFISTSYDISANGHWQKRRSYTWYLSSDRSKMDLGDFSMSLAVKDIKASHSFYEKIGYKIVNGSLDQKWAILENGTSRIGLFQGMFPTNTLTFTPSDIRIFYKKISEKGIKITLPNGIDKKEGPASFMITDPDGNPILIDQH